jgi:hypothetical protein
MNSINPINLPAILVVAVDVLHEIVMVIVAQLRASTAISRAIWQGIVLPL